MVNLFIDNIEVKRFADKLRTMHRSDLPIVVRQTLNDMAFDVKKNTLFQYADKEFILRNPSFFKRHSGVRKATGFDMKSMNSEVGIIANESKAAKQLTKQEFGGTIPNRSFIYMNQSRISGNKSKMVRKQNYLNTKGLVGGRPLRGYGNRTRKSNFVAAAYVGIRENKNVLWETKSGFTLFSIKSISFTGKGRNRGVHINSTPLADFEKNRNVNIIARPFLKPASMASFQKREYFFIRNAKKRFERAIS